MFVSCSLVGPMGSGSSASVEVVTDVLRFTGPDALVMAGVRLLTPPVREIYAVLVRAGIVVVDD